MQSADTLLAEAIAEYTEQFELISGGPQGLAGGESLIAEGTALGCWPGCAPVDPGPTGSLDGPNRAL